MSRQFTKEWFDEYQRRNAPKVPVTKTGAVEDESDLHEEIRRECDRRGWIAFHGSMAHATHRTLGEPDFTIATDDGRTFYVECKSRRGKLSPAQNAMLFWLKKNKQLAFVVSSFEEFLTIVDQK